VLREVAQGPVEFALGDELRRAVLKGERARRLQNLSIKLDAAQIHALRKIATLKIQEGLLAGHLAVRHGV
jgi:hypothetical protein